MSAGADSRGSDVAASSGGRPPASRAGRNAVRAACIAGGCALLAAGAALGGFGDVLLRGVRICLECIGLG